MKQLVLIGDSIRMGYEPFVKEALQDDAEVWGPEENGGDSRNVLAHLEEWVLSRSPGLVHINCGLHDIKKDFETGGAQVPMEEHARNVETILARLKGEGDFTIVWAMTTPVNEQWHHENKGFDRFEADVRAANGAAGEICGRLDIPVNDLYTVVMDGGRDDLLVEDGVHFKREGYEMLGNAVVEMVKNK